MSAWQIDINSVTCVIRCTSDATDSEKTDEDIDINAADCLILKSILNDGNYDISADDHMALESVCATLMPTNDLDE